MKLASNHTTPEMREWLVTVATRLLESSEDMQISTRAVCQKSGVTPPTLYHYFGSKEGLLSAVANAGFERYLRIKHKTPQTDDPVHDLRVGWNTHIAFGLGNQNLYLLMFGQFLPGMIPDGTARAEVLVEKLCSRLCDIGLLHVTPRVAAVQYLTANIGTALTLITHTEMEGNTTFSEVMREAALSMIVTPSGTATVAQPQADIRSLALTLKTRLAEHPEMSKLRPAEGDLMQDWLDRLAN